MSNEYEGIDFANHNDRTGRSWIIDNGRSLKWSPGGRGQAAVTGVDCPFGTTKGFAALIGGQLPTDEGADGFTTRQTDRWLRDHVSRYRTTQKWGDLPKEERRRLGSHAYFNRSSHIQATLRMSTVPAFLDWLARELSSPTASATSRLDVIAEARRGEGKHIEAHPRMFLYSAIERVIRADPESLTADDLAAVRDYKKRKKKDRSKAEKNRRTAYQLLSQWPSWTGTVTRVLEPKAPPPELVSSDHAFDAWLCALTAWAHDNGQTITWESAGIDREAVAREGHILVLS